MKKRFKYMISMSKSLMENGLVLNKTLDWLSVELNFRLVPNISGACTKQNFRQVNSKAKTEKKKKNGIKYHWGLY